MNKAEKLLRAKEVFSYALIFLLATVIRLSYNFLSPHPNAAFGQDAAEYLRDAQGLSKAFSLSPSFWVDAIVTAFGDPGSPKLQAIHDTLSSLKELSTGGPVFPFFILIATALFGQSVSYENSFGALFAYSLLSALTCVLIGLTAKHCWTRNTGVLAGILAALYPGFIINSGRLYSESFATFLLSVVAFLFCRAIVSGNTTDRQNLLMGFVAATLQVTRSVMAALSLFLIPLLAVIDTQKFRKSATLFVLGMGILLLPWFALQKCVLGKASFVVDRYSHFNLFLGTNVDTLGFLTFPYPSLSGIEQRSLPAIAVSAWQKSPERFIKLSLDKMPRLFKFPWNDFKASIGPFDFYSQVLFHQIILALAAIGVVVALFIDLDKNARWRLLYARLLILLLFAFDLIYLPFIAVPRYALCAMPFVIMFAAAAITVSVRSIETIKGARALFQLMLALIIFFIVERTNIFDLIARLLLNFFMPILVFEVLIKLVAALALAYFTIQLAACFKANKQASRIATLVCLVLALPSLCLPLRAHGRWYEFKYELNQPRIRFIQTIAISEAKLQQMIAHPVFIAINIADGSQLARDFSVAINGTTIHSPFIPAMSLSTGLTNLKAFPNDTAFPEVDYILSDLSNYTDIDNLQLRQWFLIPIPPEILKSYLKTWQSSSVVAAEIGPRLRKMVKGDGNPQLQQSVNRQIEKATADFKNNVTKTPELKISLTKISDHPNAIYGSYAVSDRFLMLPSIDTYSWEKGFFAVENDHGVGDLALDTKKPITEEAKQFFAGKGSHMRINPDIQILLSPELVPNDLSGAPMPSPQMKKPTAIDCPSMALMSGSDNIKNIPLPELPPASKDAVWIVRCLAKLVQEPGRREYDLGIVATFGDGEKTTQIYPSKWLPRRIQSSERQSVIDYSFPIAPSAFSGKLKGLSLSVRPLEEQHSTQPPRIQGRIDKIRFEIYQLPINPVSAGHEIL